MTTTDIDDVFFRTLASRVTPVAGDEILVVPQAIGAPLRMRLSDIVTHVGNETEVPDDIIANLAGGVDWTEVDTADVDFAGGQLEDTSIAIPATTTWLRVSIGDDVGIVNVVALRAKSVATANSLPATGNAVQWTHGGDAVLRRTDVGQLYPRGLQRGRQRRRRQSRAHPPSHRGRDSCPA